MEKNLKNNVYNNHFAVHTNLTQHHKLATVQSFKTVIKLHFNKKGDIFEQASSQSFLEVSALTSLSLGSLTSSGCHLLP